MVIGAEGADKEEGALGKAAKGMVCEGGTIEEGGGGRRGNPPMDCCGG